MKEIKLYKNKLLCDCSIRTVKVNGLAIGCIGTVSDMLKVGILEYCDYDPSAWCFLSMNTSPYRDWFAGSKEALIEYIKKC